MLKVKRVNLGKQPIINVRNINWLINVEVGNKSFVSVFQAVEM